MRVSNRWMRVSLGAAALAAPLLFGTAAPRAVADDDGCCCGHDEHEGRSRDAESDERGCASRPVVCCRGTAKKGEEATVKLLAINDFHGQIPAGKLVAGRPVGSAPVLASYLLTAAKGFEGKVLLTHSGDQVGASPAASALLQDEPSISFLNILDDKLGDLAGDGHHGRGHHDFFDWCSWGGRDSDWNVIGTLGNHEFDEGRAELFRLLDGGNFPTGPFLDKHWRGADYPTISANVFDSATHKTLLAPYAVRCIDGVKVGFIGAVTKTTPQIVTASGVAGLEFTDEADAINAAVAKLSHDCVETIVVLVHEGGSQGSFTGPTPAAPGTVSGPIVDIVKRLDDRVDVVLSGHSHQFTNAIIPNNHGVPILVTQAFSAGTAYADVTLTIDKCTGDVVQSTASIVTTWADTGPGLTPDPDVKTLTDAANAMVAPLVNRVIGTAAAPLDRNQTTAGESTLGDLIADAQRAAMTTDFAFMNPGGIRADLDAGPATWGELFAIQPFNNLCVKMTLTGNQIDALLEQQFTVNRFLQISGLTYTWDFNQPLGSKVNISQILKNGVPIDGATNYTVTVNNFLAGGGDGFTVLLGGTNKVIGPIDLDALVAYIPTLVQPFPAPALNRISRLN